MTTKPLRKFVVLFRLSVAHEADGHAYSPEEAVKLGLEQVRSHPPAFGTPWRPEAVEEVDVDKAGSWEVVGACEACDAWILDGPERTGHASTEEGDYLCAPCVGEAIRDEAAAPAGDA